MALLFFILAVPHDGIMKKLENSAYISPSHFFVGSAVLVKYNYKLEAKCLADEQHGGLYCILYV